MNDNLLSTPSQSEVEDVLMTLKEFEELRLSEISDIVALELGGTSVASFGKYSSGKSKLPTVVSNALKKLSLQNVGIVKVGRGYWSYSPNFTVDAIELERQNQEHTTESSENTEPCQKIMSVSEGPKSEVDQLIHGTLGDQDEDYTEEDKLSSTTKLNHEILVLNNDADVKEALNTIFIENNITLTESLSKVAVTKDINFPETQEVVDAYSHSRLARLYNKIYERLTYLDKLRVLTRATVSIFGYSEKNHYFDLRKALLVYSSVYILGFLSIPYVSLAALFFAYLNVLFINFLWNGIENSRDEVVQRAKPKPKEELPDLLNLALYSSLNLLIIFTLINRHLGNEWEVFSLSGNSPELAAWIWFTFDSICKSLFDWSEIYSVDFTHIEPSSVWGKHWIFFKRVTLDFILFQTLLKYMTIKKNAKDAANKIEFDQTEYQLIGIRSLEELHRIILDKEETLIKRFHALQAIKTFSHSSSFHILKKCLNDKSTEREIKISILEDLWRLSDVESAWVYVSYLSIDRNRVQSWRYVYSQDFVNTAKKGLMRCSPNEEILPFLMSIFEDSNDTGYDDEANLLLLTHHFNGENDSFVKDLFNVLDGRSRSNTNNRIRLKRYFAKKYISDFLFCAIGEDDYPEELQEFVCNMPENAKEQIFIVCKIMIQNYHLNDKKNYNLILLLGETITMKHSSAENRNFVLSLYNNLLNKLVTHPKPQTIGTKIRTVVNKLVGNTVFEQHVEEILSAGVNYYNQIRNQIDDGFYDHDYASRATIQSLFHHWRFPNLPNPTIYFEAVTKCIKNIDHSMLNKYLYWDLIRLSSAKNSEAVHNYFIRQLYWVAPDREGRKEILGNPHTKSTDESFQDVYHHAYSEKTITKSAYLIYKAPFLSADEASLLIYEQLEAGSKNKRITGLEMISKVDPSPYIDSIVKLTTDRAIDVRNLALNILLRFFDMGVWFDIADRMLEKCIDVTVETSKEELDRIIETLKTSLSVDQLEAFIYKYIEKNIDDDQQEVINRLKSLFRTSIEGQSLSFIPALFNVSTYNLTEIFEEEYTIKDRERNTEAEEESNA